MAVETDDPGAGPAERRLPRVPPLTPQGPRSDDGRADPTASVFDALREALLVLTPDLHVHSANAAFSEIFRAERSETEGRLVYDLLGGQLNLPGLHHLLEAPPPEDRFTDGHEVIHTFDSLGKRSLVFRARRVNEWILLSVEDVTEARRREREHQAAAVAESREMLQFVLDHIPEGVFWKDSEGRFLGVNAVAAHASGFESPEDLIGLTDYDLPGVTPEQAAFFRKMDQEVMESGSEMIGIEEPMGRPGGLTAWLRTNKVPMRAADGRVVGVLGTWEDVTDRKEAEKRLRQSEAAFRQLADAMPQLVWTATPDGKVDYYNRRAELYDGLSLRGGAWEWEPAVHPNDTVRTAAAWHHALAEGAPYECEHRIRIKDGTYRWHLSRAVPARMGSGRIMRWYGTATDVHALKQAEEALRQNEERLRMAQEAARVGTWDQNLLTGEVTWSEGLFGLTGVPRGGGVPSHEAWEALLHPADRERVARQMDSAIEEGGGYNNEFRLIRPDGTAVWLAAKGRVLHDDSGQAVRFVGVNFDITAQKEAEEALQRLNETLEERVKERTTEVRALASRLTMAEQEERRRLAQILHDDLQQRLFGIQLRLEMVARGAEVGDADRVVRGAKEAQAWIGEAIQATRRLTVDLSPPVLKGEGLPAALQWLAKQMEETHRLHVEIRSEAPCYFPNEDMRVLVFQAIRELLFNVVKHAGTDRARVVAWEADGRVRVAVEDEGIGFDPTALGEEKSSGLGLQSVCERLELVGGRMDIEASPGHGTRVTLTAPLAPPPAEGGGSE